jgi:DNA-binding CsgD family transcriptional regulator
MVLCTRGIELSEKGELEEGEQTFQQVIAVLGTQPASKELVAALNNLAMVRWKAGRLPEALQAVEQAFQVHDQASTQPPWLPKVMHTQGVILLGCHRVADAWQSFLSGLEYATDYGNYETAVTLLQGLACAAAETRNPTLCLELLAAAEASAHMARTKSTRGDRTAHGIAERASRAALGHNAAEAAWGRGLDLDLRAALDRARAGSPRGTKPGLTPRRAEIVQLVAEGMANKEIARRLCLSHRTVEAHLDHVRSQFGFRNRAEIVAWVTSEGLLPHPVSAAVRVDG